jgi:hypothetical protein
LLQGESVSDSKFVYNNKSDIWSLGCIVFELFTGRKAFLNDYQVFDYANMRKNQKEFMKQLGTDAKFYIHLLLEKDPKDRPSSKLLMRRKFRAAAFGSNSESLIRKRKQSDSERVTIPRFLSQTMGWAVLNGNIKAIESILFAMGPVTLSEPPCAHAMIQAVFEACINGGVFPNLAIQGAKEELLALWTALACSSPKMAQFLLLRIRNEREHRTLLPLYTQMWDDYLGLVDVKVGCDNVLNLEALYDLALRSEPNRMFQVAKVMPSAIVSWARDESCCAITKPDLDKQLRVSLVTDYPDFLDVAFLHATTVMFSPDGNFFSWTTHDHDVTRDVLWVKLIDINTSSRVGAFMINIKDMTVHALGHSSQQFYLAVGDRRGALIIHFIEDDSAAAAQFILGYHLAEVTSIYCSPNSSRLLSLGADRAVRLWDLASRTQLKSRNMIDISYHGLELTLSADGKFAALCNIDGVHVWRTDSEEVAVVRLSTFTSTRVGVSTVTTFAFAEGPTKTKNIIVASSDGLLELLMIMENTQNGTFVVNRIPHPPNLPRTGIGRHEYLRAWASSNEWAAFSVIHQPQKVHITSLDAHLQLILCDAIASPWGGMTRHFRTYNNTR